VLHVEIPNFPDVKVEYLLLDMNGTIATGGAVKESLKPYLEKLGKLVKIYMITADTFGTAKKMAGKLGIDYYILPKKKSESLEKQEFVKKLGGNQVIALGNGNNDALMLEESAIGIGVMGEEGLSKKCLQAADIIVKTPESAFEILLDSKKLCATLRS
jgi:P-type E1-E2 ATPase